MDIKFEGRQVDLGNELRERVTQRLQGLDKRFGPITHARLSVEKKAHKNEQRAAAKAVASLAGATLTAAKEAPTVLQSVNDVLDTLTNEMKSFSEKKKDKRR